MSDIRDTLRDDLRDTLIQQRRLVAQLTRVLEHREVLASHPKVAQYLTLHQQERVLNDALDKLNSEILGIASRLSEIL